MQSSCQAKRSQVNNGNRIALTIGDVSVFVVSGIKIGKFALVKVPPCKPRQNRQANHHQQKLSQAWLPEMGKSIRKLELTATRFSDHQRTTASLPSLAPAPRGQGVLLTPEELPEAPP